MEDVKSQNAQGKIITFYSYKGGTGRSMALANVAWILATNRKRVLVIDWDLEAPGLHRYFRPFLIDKQLTSSEGLIDFVIEYSDEAIKPSGPEIPTSDWYIPFADISRFALSINFASFPEPAKIDFVPAGRQNSTYATRVNSFNWQNFYDRLGGGTFFEAAKQQMKAQYDYILIDSRTGVSDTAGICTVQMPDLLVIFFTYNNQSIEGTAAVAKSVLQARQKLIDPSNRNAFNVFPVPTRVEQGELTKLDARQRYAQKVFDEVLNTKIERSVYWNEVEVPYVPYYSYEEILATINDDPNDPKKVLKPLVRITSYISNAEINEFRFPISPEIKFEILRNFAETPASTGTENALENRVSESMIQEQIRIAESSLLRMTSAEEGECRKVWTRLIRIGRLGEVKEYTRLRIPLKEFSEAGTTLIRSQAQAHLLIIELDNANGDETVEIASEQLMRNWPRLREWIESDRDFLLWRQKFRELVHDWENSGRSTDFLIRGTPLEDAQIWMNKRFLEFNDFEKAFVAEAVKNSQPQNQTVSALSTVFVVRPFGRKLLFKKDKNTGKTEEIFFDFDKVEQELIGAALRKANFPGVTSGEIFEAGDIQEEMFSLLLLADVVVGDITSNSSSVFYQLGIRHALRDKKTILIKALGFDDTPFDILGYPSISYDGSNPADSIPDLSKALRENTSGKDSPVFRMLPKLQSHEPESFLAVPQDFDDEVKVAKATGHSGKLALLGSEAQSFSWALPALRIIGEAQYKMRSFENALLCWETIQSRYPDDPDANDFLANLYQRLAGAKMNLDKTGGLEMLAKSDLAVKRLLENISKLDKSKKAEIYALRARNARTRWILNWKDAPQSQQAEKALLSSYLKEAYEDFENSYNEDLNLYYSGMQAISLLTIIISLAERLPNIWGVEYKSDEESAVVLKNYKERRQMLSAMVEGSILYYKKSLGKDGREDPWLNLTEADLACLTSDRAERVSALYSKVLLESNSLNFEPAKRQLQVYQQLEVKIENVKAALKAFSTIKSEINQSEDHFLMFVGHMIDKPGSGERRFPPDKEETIRNAIKKAVQDEYEKIKGNFYGISSGACGGDILFQEVCSELGISTQLFLPVPRDMFLSESVLFAGSQWVERFDSLYKRLSSNILASTKELPKWLWKRHPYSIWDRNNLWMLSHSLESGGLHASLIALWDGKETDEPGGVSQIIKEAATRGVKTIIININRLI